MMSKAWALGLETDPAFNAQYSNLGAKYALDTLHESWNMTWGFPRSRSIAANSSLANRVVIRSQNDQYRPGDLRFSDGEADRGDTIAIVVGAVPALAAQAAGG